MDLPSAFHLASQSTPLPGRGSSHAMLPGHGRFLCLRPLTQVVSAVTAAGCWKKWLRVQAGQVGMMLLVMLLESVMAVEKSSR